MKDNKRPIPEKIDQVLDRTLRLDRTLTFARGASISVSIFLIALLAACAVDRFFPIYGSGLRMLLAVAVFVPTFAATWVFLLRPLMRSIERAEVARYIENFYDDSEERLSSTVELLTASDPPEIRGSQGMINTLAAQAEKIASKVNPRSFIRLNPLYGMLGFAGFLLIFVFVLVVLWPAAFGRQVSRILYPFGNFDRVSRTKLFISPGNSVLVKGKSLLIEARTEGMPADEAVMIMNSPKGEQFISMKPAGDNRFAEVVRGVADSFTYRVRANDQITREYEVRVVEPPRITRTDVTYDYPDYTGLDDRKVEKTDGDVRAIKGTHATLKVFVNHPIKNGYMEVINGTRMPLVQIDRQIYKAEIDMTENGHYRFLLVDEEGFTNENPQTRSIIVDSDRSPRADILMPTDTVNLSPDAKLKVFLSAADDFRLTRAKLEVKPKGADPQNFEISLPEKADKWEGQYELDLARVELGSATELDYRIIVEDNLPAEPLGGPQEGKSPVRKIILKEGSLSFEAQLTQTLREQIQTALEEAGKALRQAQKEHKALSPLIDGNKPLNDDGLGKVQLIRELVGKGEEELAKVDRITRLTEYEKVGGEAERISRMHLVPARLACEDAKLSADNTKALPPLSAQAGRHIESAIIELDKLIEMFKALSEAEKRAERLSQLTDTQKSLTNLLRRRAEDMESIEDLTKAEQELLKELAKLLDEQPQLKAKAIQGEINALASLREKLDSLIREQTELLERTRKRQEFTGLQGELEKLRQQQRQLGDKAKELSDRAQKLLPENKTLPALPADLAEKLAAINEGSRKFVNLQARIEDAMRKMEEIFGKRAEELRPSADPGPKKAQADKSAQLASESAALAEEQKKIAERIQSLASPDAVPQDIRNQAAQKQKEAQEAEKVLEELRKQLAAAKQATEAAAKQAVELKPQADKAKADADNAAQAAEELSKRLQATNQRLKDIVEKIAQQKGENDPGLNQQRQEAKKQAEELEENWKKQNEDAKRLKTFADELSGKAQQAEKQAKDKTAEAAAVEKKIQEEQPKVQAAQEAAKKADQAVKSAEEKRNKELAEAIQKQAEVAAKSAKLSESAKSHTPEAAEALKQNEAMVKSTQAAAEAVKQNRFDQAAGAQKEAAEKLKNFSEALQAQSREQKKIADGLAAKRAEELAKQKPFADAAETAKNLRAEQKQLRKQLADKNKRFTELEKDLPGKEREALAQEQAALGEEYIKLAETAGAAAGQSTIKSPSQNLHELARSAAEQIQKEAFASAESLQKRMHPFFDRLQQEVSQRASEERAKKAEQEESNQWGEIYDDLDREALPGPDGSPIIETGPHKTEYDEMSATELAGKIQALRKRQSAIERKTSQYADGRPEGAASDEQEDLARKTNELGENFEQTMPIMQELLPDALAPTDEAIKILDTGVNPPQLEAGKALNAGAFGEALKHQQQAAKGLEEVRKKLIQIGEIAQTKAAKSQKNADEYEDDAAGKILEAMQKQAEALQMMADQDPAAAIAAMKLASGSILDGTEDLWKLAEKMGLNLEHHPSAAGQMVRQEGSKSSVGTPLPEIPLRWRLIGTTSAEWARLHETSDGEAVDAAQNRIPTEYRDLIRRYFQTISHLSAGKPDNGEEQK
jgi:hypothetical protein